MSDQKPQPRVQTSVRIDADVFAYLKSTGSMGTQINKLTKASKAFRVWQQQRADK